MSKSDLRTDRIADFCLGLQFQSSKEVCAPRSRTMNILPIRYAALSMVSVTCNQFPFTDLLNY